MSSPAISVSGVAVEPRRESATGYFQRALPGQIILASFFAVTLPMAAVISFTSLNLLTAAYLCLFGTTHFLVTLTIYMRSDNLRHFSSGLRNKILFFGIPILLFSAFYVIGALRLAAAFPLFGFAFHAVVRLADFNHLNRQSFGVHQLFKARAGLRAPLRLKKLENIYFCVLSGLLYCTYLTGGRTPLLVGSSTTVALAPVQLIKPVALCLLIAAAGLLAVIVHGLVSAWRQAGQPAGLADVLAYLAFQTASAVFAVISLPLYAASLAMHYVEYHVLMFPRCFHTDLDSASALDRWFGRLRSSHTRFYGTLIAASIVIYGLMAVSFSLMGMDARPDAGRYLLFAALFDGLFVFHYFVETLIWRFGDPFFRKDMKLYFAPKT